MGVRGIEQLEGRQLFAAAPFTLSVIKNAAESGPADSGPVNGQFRIRRTGTDNAARLEVTLRVGGSATYGADYTLPTAPVARRVTVVIGAGKASTILTVTPIDDTRIDAEETVTITGQSDTSTPFDDPIPTATLTITDDDDPQESIPVAAIGGPYETREGKSVTLSGTGSAAGTKQIVLYEWDLDYDGVAFDVDAKGDSPVFDAKDKNGFKDGETYTVGLRVTDSNDLTSDVVTADVTVLNSAPTGRLLGSKVKFGKSAPVKFVDVVDSPSDVFSGLTFRYDWNNDGLDDLATKKSSAVVPAAYLRKIGRNVIHATIRDVDGATTSYPAVIMVTGASSSTKNPQSTRSIDTPTALTATVKSANPFGSWAIQPDKDQLDLI